MNDFIQIYCERSGPGLLAEPLNTITNLSFFIAAFFAWWLAKQHNALHRGTKILIGLLLCIGTGSTLFHMTAANWAQWADVLPILFYQVQFIALYAAHVMRLSPKKTLGLLALFFLTVFAFAQVPETMLNGSLAYAPALIFLGGLAVYHYRFAGREKAILLLAAGTFLVSLCFRSLDRQFCPEMPLGLHFMWHVLNGFLLYLTARAYILNARGSFTRS